VLGMFARDRLLIISRLARDRQECAPFAYDKRGGLMTVLEIFDKRIGDIRTVIVGDASSLAFDLLHQTVEVIARIGDADHADRGSVPQAGGIELRHRNVEARAQTVFQAAYDLSAVLQ
jgi:hypothetical protein